MMSERSALADVAHKWISLWNVPVDWQLFDALHAASFEDLSPADRTGTKQAFAQGLSELIQAFPDLRTTAEDLVIDVDRKLVAVRWSASGVNRKRFLGVGPTNRITHITGIEIIEIQAGRIARRWGEWDVTDHKVT